MRQKSDLTNEELASALDSPELRASVQRHMLSENIGLVDKQGKTIYRRESMLIGEKGQRAMNESPHFEEEEDVPAPEEANLVSNLYTR